MNSIERSVTPHTPILLNDLIITRLIGVGTPDRHRGQAQNMEPLRFTITITLFITHPSTEMVTHASFPTVIAQTHPPPWWHGWTIIPIA